VSDSEIVVRSFESLAQTLLCGAGQGDCPKGCSDPLVPLIKCCIVFSALLLFGYPSMGLLTSFFLKKKKKKRKKLNNPSPETLNFKRKYKC